jgi:hypothetical protein
MYTFFVYNVGMKRIQYTIRNVPEEVDGILHQKAREQGKSFNQTVVETLQQATIKPKTVGDSLDWFIGKGSNMTLAERKKEEEAQAWLDSLPKEIETYYE